MRNMSRDSSTLVKEHEEVEQELEEEKKASDNDLSVSKLPASKDEHAALSGKHKPKQAPLDMTKASPPIKSVAKFLAPPVALPPHAVSALKAGATLKSKSPPMSGPSFQNLPPEPASSGSAVVQIAKPSVIPLLPSTKGAPPTRTRRGSSATSVTQFSPPDVLERRVVVPTDISFEGSTNVEIGSAAVIKSYAVLFKDRIEFFFDELSFKRFAYPFHTIALDQITHVTLLKSGALSIRSQVAETGVQQAVFVHRGTEDDEDLKVWTLEIQKALVRLEDDLSEDDRLSDDPNEWRSDIEEGLQYPDDVNIIFEDECVGLSSLKIGGNSEFVVGSIHEEDNLEELVVNLRAQVASLQDQLLDIGKEPNVAMDQLGSTTISIGGSPPWVDDRAFESDVIHFQAKLTLNQEGISEQYVVLYSKRLDFFLDEHSFVSGGYPIGRIELHDVTQTTYSCDKTIGTGKLLIHVEASPENADDEEEYEPFTIILTAPDGKEHTLVELKSKLKGVVEESTPYLTDVNMVSFKVDNKFLNANAAGVAYRNSMALDDQSEYLAPFETIVKGMVINATWIQVGDYFLPRTLHGVPVLIEVFVEEEPQEDPAVVKLLEVNQKLEEELKHAHMIREAAEDDILKQCKSAMVEIAQQMQQMRDACYSQGAAEESESTAAIREALVDMRQSLTQITEEIVLLRCGQESANRDCASSHMAKNVSVTSLEPKALGEGVGLDTVGRQSRTEQSLFQGLTICQFASSTSERYVVLYPDRLDFYKDEVAFARGAAASGRLALAEVRAIVKDPSGMSIIVEWAERQDMSPPNSLTLNSCSDTTKVIDSWFEKLQAACQDTQATISRRSFSSIMEIAIQGEEDERKNKWTSPRSEKVTMDVATALLTLASFVEDASQGRCSHTVASLSASLKFIQATDRTVDPVIKSLHAAQEPCETIDPTSNLKDIAMRLWFQRIEENSRGVGRAIGLVAEKDIRAHMACYSQPIELDSFIRFLRPDRHGQIKYEVPPKAAMVRFQEAPVAGTSALKRVESQVLRSAVQDKAANIRESTRKIIKRAVVSPMVSTSVLLQHALGKTNAEGGKEEQKPQALHVENRRSLETKAEDEKTKEKQEALHAEVERFHREQEDAERKQAALEAEIERETIAFNMADGEALDREAAIREALQAQAESQAIGNFTGAELANLEDLAKLTFIDEEAILTTLQKRYELSRIYTWTGATLLSLNPFSELSIYSDETLKTYIAIPRQSRKAHIFSVGSNAYHALQVTRRTQMVILSGESGSGKTEAAKLVLKLFSEMGSYGQVASLDTSIEMLVATANPILEALGNARTLRNNNSSRFGRYTRLTFANQDGPRLRMKSVRLQTNLLETVRVTNIQEGERNYHIFYQMIAAGRISGPPQQYRFLSQSTCVNIEGVNDNDEFHVTHKAMGSVGFTPTIISEMFSILKGILLLGNVTFFDKDSAAASVDPQTNHIFLEACDCLGVQPTVFETSLATQVLRSGGKSPNSTLTKHLDAKTANSNIEATAQRLYNMLFQFSVDTINAHIGQQFTFDEEDTSCGLLDIFGFEDFTHNSLEQLCINYANELMQRYYTAFIFKGEERIYRAEGLTFNPVDSPSNEHVIELLESKPLGIFAQLNEECFLPQGSDEKFVSKIRKTNWKPDLVRAFHADRLKRNTFSINHYCGRVQYDVEGFMVKNQDMLSGDILEALRQSRFLTMDTMLDAFEASEIQQHSARSSRRPTNSAVQRQKKTVLSAFQNQLEELNDAMNAANPSFVRCIKPNPEKVPIKFSDTYVLHQLRSSGVLQAITVSRSGYPVRMNHRSIIEDYNCLLLSREPVFDATTLMERLNTAYKLGAACTDDTPGAPKAPACLVGTNLVFMKQSAYTMLQQARLQLRINSTLRLQRLARKKIAARVY